MSDKHTCINPFLHTNDQFALLISGFVMKESINKMVVVEMPQSKPVITGGHQELPGAPKMKYKPGDVLNLTCTSAPSNPPAQLEWRLNDKKVCTLKRLLWAGASPQWPLYRMRATITCSGLETALEY